MAVDDPADVRRRENWAGGEAYQLALSYGPLSDGELARAVEGLIAAAGLRTPKRGAGRGFVARLPNGRRVVCRISSGRDDGAAFVTLYFPMEALRLTDRRIDSFYLGHDAGLDWRRPLDDWLADVARRVYEAVPFRAGLIGCEVTALEPPPARGPVPAVTGVGMLAVRRGELRYVPAT